MEILFIKYEFETYFKGKKNSIPNINQWVIKIKNIEL